MAKKRSKKATTRQTTKQSKKKIRATRAGKKRVSKKRVRKSVGSKRAPRKRSSSRRSKRTSKKSTRAKQASINQKNTIFLLIIFALLFILILFFGASRLDKFRNTAAPTSPESPVKDQLTDTRDFQRRADLKLVKVAVDRYYREQGAYPLIAGEKAFITAEDFGKKKATLFYQEYLIKQAQDPLSNENWPTYLYWQLDDDSYVLLAKLENDAKLELKPDPLDFNQQIKTLVVSDLDTPDVRYNYWIFGGVGGGAWSEMIDVSQSEDEQLPVNTGTTNDSVDHQPTITPIKKQKYIAPTRSYRDPR